MKQDRKKLAESVQNISLRMFQSLARAFPVACASDEFYYFPQVRLPEKRWSEWDNFSPDFIMDTARSLSEWETELSKLETKSSHSDLSIDITLLKTIAKTLREQLTEVRTWERQPTFYLTLANIGLAEAIAVDNPEVLQKRASTLPEFLDQAGGNLRNVPVLFRDLGLEMCLDTKKYIAGLTKSFSGLDPAYDALLRYEKTLRKVPVCDHFRLEAALLEKILQQHIGCDLYIQEIAEVLDLEIKEMQAVLKTEAHRFESSNDPDFNGSQTWMSLLRNLPLPQITKQELTLLYKEEVSRLSSFCLDQDLIPQQMVQNSPVSVKTMPDELSTIRTASSYSISPSYPAQGGTFYILQTFESREAQTELLREYRMLTAHETYPGHHVLDSTRWTLDNPIRRVLEFPIFYEGWACFAESLLQKTGYFSGPKDRLLLAKRRLWRAVRGKVDLGLQTGDMDMAAAKRTLIACGISKERAESSVRRYPLNPGYQLCYTLGLRRFLDLFESYGHERPSLFVSTILTQGEIGFVFLEDIFKS